jgi:hypothetical protein
MIKPEQGPGDMGVLAKQVPKASITALRGLICCGCDTCLSKAIAAALNAWPGMQQRIHIEQAIILPLPTEASDE